MSRSNPRRSNIAEKLRQSESSASHPAPHDRSLRRRVNIKFAAFMRWLHIYLSMFGLAAVLFFSVTGITLNHPDWFFEKSERSDRADGRMEPRWLRPASPPPGADADPLLGVAKLEVAEFLRKAHGVRGAVTEFRADEAECTVAFKGPGYSADAFIDRDTGKYTLTQSYHGFIAVMNDLHKGRDTGKAWSWVIDVSAVGMTIISLTGLVLLFYLKRRRLPGLVVTVVGAVAVLVVVWLWVP